MTVAEALDLLASYDHAILYPEQGYEIAAALGIDREHVPVRKVTDTRSQFKGATLNGLAEGESAKSVVAHELACSLADSLGLEFPFTHGKGSQLRVAVGALRRHFGEGVTT